MSFNDYHGPLEQRPCPALQIRTNTRDVRMAATRAECTDPCTELQPISEAKLVIAEQTASVAKFSHLLPQTLVYRICL